MPFIGPLKGEKRTPHASFRRHSRPLGQAYAPSEVSGILFLNSIQKNERQDDILFLKATKNVERCSLFINLKSLIMVFE